MPFTWLNSAVGTGAGVTNLATAAKNHPQGSLILVGLVCNSSLDSITSVTNTAADIFIQAVGSKNTGVSGAGLTDIWYAYNSKGNASDIVTGHCSTSTLSTVFAECYLVAPGNILTPFEVGVIGTASILSSSVTSASFSPALAGNLNFGVISSALGGHTYVAGGSAVLRQTDANNHADQDIVSAAAGAQTMSMSISSGTDTFELSVASFKLGNVISDLPQQTMGPSYAI